MDNSPAVRLGMVRLCAEDDDGKAGHGDASRFGRHGGAFGCRLASAA